MNYDLVGIGNALVDIEVQVSDDLVKDLEITKGGMTLSTKENQDAARALAADPEVEVIVVIGGRHSANSLDLHRGVPFRSRSAWRR